jgi:uncharacterized coiled-coil DUF342 family protein
MEEEFRVIKGFENYSVSNFGNVANVKNGKMLKPFIDVNGYKVVKLFVACKGLNQKIHRLVAQTHIPNPNNKPNIDHIDNNKLNNNITNLRWCSSSQNNMNSSLRIDNTSSVKGVSFYKRANKWRARVNYNKSEYHLGLFNTLEEAKEARIKKANELFGEFANKCEKIKTELEELLELEKELEDLIK